MKEAYIECKCGKWMIKRQRQHDVGVFFGCVAFPDCREILSEQIAKKRWMENGALVAEYRNGREMYRLPCSVTGLVDFW